MVKLIHSSTELIQCHFPHLIQSIAFQLNPHANIYTNEFTSRQYAQIDDIPNNNQIKGHPNERA